VGGSHRRSGDALARADFSASKPVSRRLQCIEAGRSLLTLWGRSGPCAARPRTAAAHGVDADARLRSAGSSHSLIIGRFAAAVVPGRAGTGFSGQRFTLPFGTRAARTGPCSPDEPSLLCLLSRGLGREAPLGSAAVMSGRDSFYGRCRATETVAIAVPSGEAGGGRTAG
jgi:hypothetical protein